MTTAITQKTNTMIRGTHAWRITRYAVDHFVAVNNKGVTRIYDNQWKADKFIDFLESVGFRLRQDKWSLETIVRNTPSADTAEA